MSVTAKRNENRESGKKDDDDLAEKEREREKNHSLAAGHCGLMSLIMEKYIKLHDRMLQQPVYFLAEEREEEKARERRALFLLTRHELLYTPLRESLCFLR